jgi:hypothetical protein
MLIHACSQNAHWAKSVAFETSIGCWDVSDKCGTPAVLCRIPLILTGIPAQLQLLPSRDRAIIQEGRGEAAERRIILELNHRFSRPLLGRRVSPIARLYRLAAMSGYALAPMVFKAKWLASPCGG